MADDARWYAIHTYSGYENKVADSIRKIVENRSMQDSILDVCVPTEIVKKVTADDFSAAKDTDEKVDGSATAEDVESEGAEKSTRKKKNKKDEYERKLFPGYVLVKIALKYDDKSEQYKIGDETWYVIRNTRGVTGFVGPESKPVPLSEDEVFKFGVEKREVIDATTEEIEHIDFGRRVIVVDYKVGDIVNIVTMPGFSGVVQKINLESNVVKVVCSMFGRDTVVEAELDQVELAID